MKLPVSQIKSNPNNPRFIKDDKFKKLVQSLKDFPEMAEVREVVINKDHVILGGNMRFKAMQEAGWTEIPVKIVDWSEDKQREFIIKDNVSGGEWDWDLIANEWDSQLLEDWGLDMPVVEEDQEVEEDEAPEVSSEPPVSQLGVVYQLGRHRVMCGDSTDKASVELLMNGIKADMVFTDPPYGMDLDTDYSKLKGTDKSPNAKGYKWDAVIGDDREFDFRQFSYLEAKEQFWWGADYYFNQLPNNGGLFVWQKRDKADEKMIGNDFEICWSKQRHKKATIWKRWVGFDSIERGEKRVHPTQKPIEVCGYFVENFSNKGYIVLDLFLGSGSTLIACEQTDRTCYGMELDPKYVDVIRKRYAKFISPDNQLPENWEELTPEISTGAAQNG
jgi:DNA modification methylase